MTLALQGKPKGRQWLLVAFALLAVIAAAGASLVVRSANADGTTPLSNQASLGTGVSGTRTCAAGIPFYEVGKEGEWHFIINGLASEAVAPTHIHATFAVAGTVQINLTAFNGGSAHYTLTSNLTDTLLSAAAPLTGVDYNNFVLSHAPCTVKVNPNITTTLHLGASAGEGVTPTTVAVGGSVAFNSVLHDSATVGGSAGAATGTVTFKFFNNKTCTGTPVSTSAAIALVGGVAHPSQDVSALAPGDYGFLAHYNGEDSDYNAIDDNECEWFHVRANPSGNVSVVKTAAGTYERHCTWTLEKSVDKTSVVLSSDNSEATLTYTVKWTKECVDSKFVISGNITVANAGTSPDSFEITDVKDVLPGAVIDCGDPDDGIPFTLAPGAQKVCTYSATAASAAAGVNTASATADGVEVGSPPVNYTFTLGADTGETALLNDALLGIVNKLVDASGSLETNNTYKVELGEGCQQTTVRNVAVLTPAGGEPLEKTATTTVDRLCIDVSKTAAGTFDRTCRWDLDKKVDDNSKVVLPGGNGVFNYTVVVDLIGCDNTGYEVHGTITVANTGSIAVTVDVTDDVVDPNGTCSVTDGLGAAIAAGESKDFEYSCTFPGTAAAGTNTASATATAGGASVTETGNKGYSFALDKLVDGCVAVSDTLGEGPNTIICEKDGDQTYPYAHTWTASVESCRAEDFKNTATLTGDGDKELDSDEVTVTLEKVCVTISKLADLDYTRTCTPDVNKSALEETAGITLGQGQTGTIHWKVEATLDCANKDGVVSGTITVKNTGSVAATLVVTDTLAIVVCPDYTLDPGQEVVCTYSAAHAIEGGTNSATAKLTAEGVEASATATDPFEVVAKPQGCYTVTDSNSANNFQLCDDGTTAHYQNSFSYEQTVGPYALGCTERTVDNTAIVTHNETKVDSDKASVVIRVPCIRGYTVGFWGNQNGEARLHQMGDPVVNLLWKNANYPVNFATGQLILPNSSNFCGLGGVVSCTKTTLDSGVNPNSVNNLAQQTLALSYNSLYRGATFSNQTLGFMGCDTSVAGLGSLGAGSTIADALAYANFVLGNVSTGFAPITQTQVGAVNTLLGGCLNLEN